MSNTTTRKPTTIDLPPCHFCGGEEINGPRYQLGRVTFVCATCEASGPPALMSKMVIQSTEKEIEAAENWKGRVIG